MVFSDVIHAMLLTHGKWTSFSSKPMADARRTGEVHIILSAESRDEVNAIADAAGRAGGKADVDPPQDKGFMFGRSFEDPDGHIREVCWMDPAAMPPRA